jgi:hypothetical protein
MADEEQSSSEQGSSEEGDKPTRGVAPSSPDLDKLERFEPAEKGEKTRPSDTDAMGRDKRREVVGHSYGPSKRRQLMFFVVVGAILAVIIGGWTLAVAAFDQPPDSNPDQAPWSAADAPQKPPRSPAGPCGEPGSAYPPPADSPCATAKTSVDEPPLPGTTKQGPEQGGGGAIGGGSESEANSSSGVAPPD